MEMFDYVNYYTVYCILDFIIHLIVFFFSELGIWGRGSINIEGEELINISTIVTCVAAAIVWFIYIMHNLD